MSNCEDCYYFDTLVDFKGAVWYKCLMGHVFDCDGKDYDSIFDEEGLND